MGGDPQTSAADRRRRGSPAVKTHVNRVLAKLAVTTRVQAVVTAYEHGLVGVR